MGSSTQAGVAALSLAEAELKAAIAGEIGMSYAAHVLKQLGEPVKGTCVVEAGRLSSGAACNPWTREASARNRNVLVGGDVPDFVQVLVYACTCGHVCTHAVISVCAARKSPPPHRMAKYSREENSAHTQESQRGSWTPSLVSVALGAPVHQNVALTSISENIRVPTGLAARSPLRPRPALRLAPSHAGTV